MTLLEHEHRVSQRGHHKAAKRQRRQQQQKRQRQQRLPLPLPAVLHDDQVLTFTEWCTLNSISPRTGRRILAGPERPAVVQLSARRLGVTVRNNRLWQQTRERA
jgi:hypothetical protein